MRESTIKEVEKNENLTNFLASCRRKLSVMSVVAVLTGLAYTFTVADALATDPPFTFTPGTPAKASEVNENFGVLFDAIDDLKETVELLNTKVNSAASLAQGAAFNVDAFQIVDGTGASITYEAALDSVVFTITGVGDAGSIAPIPVGGVDGAPILGYVFTTNLVPADVGFHEPGLSGTVALAVTSHPDFDDTPLWDEDNNENYEDDGVVYHSHWVLLVSDDRARAGLVARQQADGEILPPTAPMPMYLDSPGFAIVESGNAISAIVPADRLNRKDDLTADALTAFMQVNILEDGSPLLKVEQVYDSEAGLTLANAGGITTAPWPASSSTDPGDVNNDGSFTISGAGTAGAIVEYVQDLDTLVFTMNLQSNAGVQYPAAVGSVDGAPVLGYVFPTSLTPGDVGFKEDPANLAAVALAVTSHPDFDDTPFFDENGNADYEDDGVVYHTHLVALVDVGGGALAVPSQPDATKLPPTAPMAMYLDSPGFHAFASGTTIRVIVPAQRVNNNTTFNYDAVTAVMSVDASGAHPVLNVDTVLSALDGGLTISTQVTPRATLGDLAE